MEKRRVNRIFTFETEHVLPYSQNDIEPEKALSWYNHVVNGCTTIGSYTKKLILSFFESKGPESEKRPESDHDLEAGQRNSESPMRTVSKEAWPDGANV